MNEAAQEHETKWTPGPWGIEGAGLDNNRYYQIVPLTKAGELDWAREIGETVDDNIANAHLIAAAPRLYAALEALFGAFGHKEIAEAEAALAEARGGVAS